MTFLGTTVAYWNIPRVASNRTDPLPDLFFDSIIPEPYCPKVHVLGEALNLQSLVLVCYYAYLGLAVGPMHRSPLLVFIRFLLIDALVFATRCARGPSLSPPPFPPPPLLLTPTPSPPPSAQPPSP
jgi:hypothetical protein